MKRPFLLDTNACIWWIAGELAGDAESVLAEAYRAGLPTFVSPITALEVATLVRKRRFRSNMPPRLWFDTLMTKPGLKLAPMPPELLIESQLLPGEIPSDPADRIIAATAREYGYTVMTRDRALLDYGAQGYLSVLEC